MTHFHGTGFLAFALLFCFSLSATMTQAPAYAFSLDLHVCLPERARSLSDRCCHKVSYMVPRVRKLPDAGDKGVRSGREASEMHRLAVCWTGIGAKQQICFGFFSRCFPSVTVTGTTATKELKL